VHLKNITAWKYKKSGLRDVKRAGFIRNWRRSGIKIPDKPKIFIKKLYKLFAPLVLSRFGEDPD